MWLVIYICTHLRIHLWYYFALVIMHLWHVLLCISHIEYTFVVLLCISRIQYTFVVLLCISCIQYTVYMYICGIIMHLWLENTMVAEV